MARVHTFAMGKRKPTIKPSADHDANLALIIAATHHLNELDMPFIIMVEGASKVMTNMKRTHIMAMLREYLQLQDKIDDLEMDKQAEQIVNPNIPKDEDD
jgi:hypothetical protein